MNYPSPIKLSEHLAIPGGRIKFKYVPENSHITINLNKTSWYGETVPNESILFVKEATYSSKIKYILLIIGMGAVILFLLPSIRKILSRNRK